jgi:hypothetical protein
LWRRPRPKLGCGAKERRRKIGEERNKYMARGRKRNFIGKTVETQAKFFGPFTHL